MLAERCFVILNAASEGAGSRCAAPAGGEGLRIEFENEPPIDRMSCAQKGHGRTARRRGMADIVGVSRENYEQNNRNHQDIDIRDPELRFLLVALHGSSSSKPTYGWDEKVPAYLKFSSEV
jgi:hypothetical protein